MYMYAFSTELPQILPGPIPTAPPGEISVTTGVPTVTNVDTGTSITIILVIVHPVVLILLILCGPRMAQQLHLVVGSQSMQHN